MLPLLDVPLHSPTVLQVLWLILIAVLWIGFFFLEGFDFGVGMLLPFLGKNDKERRLIVNTIGPHWDGNEVWLLTAGGAMFAAFPGWYATLFSGLYLPLFLVLVGLILRGVAFEYRGKNDDLAWRKRWDWAAAIGSFLPTLVLGVGFANFLIGLKVAPHELAFGDTTVPLFAGTFWGLFSPFALLGGLLFVALFATHGAFFIALKTHGVIHERAEAWGSKIVLAALVLLLAVVIWGNLHKELPGQLDALRVVAWITGVVAIAGLACAWFMNKKGRDGWAFIGTAISIVMLIVMYFAHFYPGLGFDNSLALDTPLDLTTASSSPKTLQIMTICACCLVPVVLAYQVWSYWIYRKRLSTANIPDDAASAQEERQGVSA
ncbi:MAG: cytochrome d ubiquinol oxidase subunit II [Propionibacteriaceae bacterium]|nr:cytochrome d ubiquinol oxidase subunit II [Propionibacteriaceae bacterium]